MLLKAWALLFGVASLWSISEQDLYWQIRAGTELWQTGHFPHTDTWSFSAPGAPWLNIQWLSTLVFAATYHLGGIPGLVLLRGLCVAFLMERLGRTLQRLAPRAAWAMHTAVLGLCYTALLPRLQLRSDLLVLLVAAELVRLRSSPQAEASPLRLAAWAVGLTLLASNLHAGTAPFVGLMAAQTVLSLPWPWGTRLAWLCGLGLAAVATPYGVSVWPLLWAHLDYAHHNVLPNPDHLPWTLAYLSWPHSRGAGWAAVLLALAAMLGACRLKGQKALEPAAYRAWGQVAAVSAVLVALSANRLRAVPYAVIYSLPWAVAGLTALGAQLRLKGRWRSGWRRRRGQAAAAFAAAVPLLLAAGTLYPLWPEYGLQLSRATFPIDSTAFVAAHKPKANLMHTYAFGAYTVWALRDYPDYVDTRESPFWPLGQEILRAYHSPEVTQRLYERYHINTSLMPIPSTQWLSNGERSGFDDVLERFMPRAHWALVFFDRLSVVMVRRLPEHQKLIETQSYTLLRPNLPAGTYLHQGQRTPQRDARFAQEIARCRREVPDSAYCAMAQAAWWKVTDRERYRAEAVALLTQAQGHVPPRCPQQQIQVTVDLVAALEDTGQQQRAHKLEATLGAAQRF